MTDLSIVRDRWGRPWVTTDGGPLKYDKGKRTPNNAKGYTRVSTLSGALDDKGNLGDWLAANAMVGMVKDRSIAAQVGSLTSKYGDPWNVPEGKKAIKPLVKRAQEAGGSQEASSLGTAFHEFCEVIDEGRWPDYAPPELTGWLHAYREAMDGYENLDSEVFVVNDELGTAGSFDRVKRTRREIVTSEGLVLPAGLVMVGDIKSGKHDPNYPLKVTMQVAIYANSERYDQKTGARTPIHPDLDRKTGLLIHAPIRGGGKPGVKVYPLDLEFGMDMARLAVEVRAARSWESGKDSKLVAL